MQKYGGKRVNTSNNCFLYGGPEKQRRLIDENASPPSFESLSKNRVLEEKRFYLNNSNSKYISMGIVPATKILSPDAPGFYFEVFLGGDKCASMPLGGLNGLITLLSTIEEIPVFSKMSMLDHGIERGENIEISTVEFANNVS